MNAVTTPPATKTEVVFQIARIDKTTEEFQRECTACKISRRRLEHLERQSVHDRIDWRSNFSGACFAAVTRAQKASALPRRTGPAAASSRGWRTNASASRPCRRREPVCIPRRPVVQIPRPLPGSDRGEVKLEAVGCRPRGPETSSSNFSACSIWLIAMSLPQRPKESVARDRRVRQSQTACELCGPNHQRSRESVISFGRAERRHIAHLERLAGGRDRDAGSRRRKQCWPTSNRRPSAGTSPRLATNRVDGCMRLGWSSTSSAALKASVQVLAGFERSTVPRNRRISDRSGSTRSSENAERFSDSRSAPNCRRIMTGESEGNRCQV